MYPPIRVVNRSMVFYRRVVLANLFGALSSPLIFLLGIGFGVGSLVDRNASSVETLGGTSYFAFYATALLATTAMFLAGNEALWATLDGFAWSRSYQAMISTPLEPSDVATGLGIYYGLRALVGTAGVAIVLALFSETRSFGLLPALLPGVMTGLAFAMPFAAWTASRESEYSFPALLRFIINPMFLFGGVFYPIDQLPTALQVVAWLTPLWHGIELCRSFVLGGLSTANALIHFGVLSVYIIGGWLAATITFRRRLWQ